MKRQYLGDSRDAFKWDFLHWICTRSAPPFGRLLFVPLLTADDQERRDGQTHHSRFNARPFIGPFVDSLTKDERGLAAVSRLGALEPSRTFAVEIHAPHRTVLRGARRAEYWTGLKPLRYADTLVFLDPDNGFETARQRGDKWVLHAEVRWLLDELPASSAVGVYQHRPRESWQVVFRKLTARLDYAGVAMAAYDYGLAFLLMVRDQSRGARINLGATSYSRMNPKVQIAELPVGSKASRER